MKIKSWLLGLFVLVIIFGGIGVTTAFNLWQTESTKIPVKIGEGEYAGEYNPADIKGSYSIGEISELFEIPLVDLVTAFELEGMDGPEDFKCSELESLYANLEEMEIGTDSVRVFVALYTGLPYTLTESTYLPQPAVDILKTKIVSLTEAQIAFLDSHGVDINNVEIISLTEETEQSDTEEHETLTELVIKGNTTFSELLDWGLSEGDIETIIGEELPAKSTGVRDYAVDKGIEFSLIKDALQAKVDSLP